MRKRSEAKCEVALTKALRSYLQGWRHGTKGDLKKGPANQKDETLRGAYLVGFEHGRGDKQNAEQHGKQHYGDNK